MNNEYGLDARYFKEKLGQLVRDADNYTPEEMSLALKRLASTAECQIVKPRPLTRNELAFQRFCD